jgi:hypothetical protein
MRTGTLHKLTARQVAAAGDGMHSDGGGLFLRVRGGSKTWVFRFTRDGRKREMGLGGISSKTLARARQDAMAARELVTNGEDPIIFRALDTVHNKIVTFKHASQRFIDLHDNQWRNPKLSVVI